MIRSLRYLTSDHSVEMWKTCIHLQDINEFLDVTFGRNIEVKDFFPDVINSFIQ